MLEQELQKLGLSDKEARVYLSSLRLGKSVVQEIAQQAKVNRAKAYSVVYALMKKGLISTYTQGKKTYYTAESPDQLSSLFKIQEQELKERKAHFFMLFPELRSLYGSADNKPKVKYYEGIAGLKILWGEYLKVKSKKIDNILSWDNALSIFSDVDIFYTSKRVSKGIQSRFLYTSKKGHNRKLEESDKRELRKSKFIPYDKFPFEADISIFDNKVAIESYGDKRKAYGFLVEDENSANSLRMMFEFVWNNHKFKRNIYIGNLVVYNFAIFVNPCSIGRKNARQKVTNN